MIEKVTEYILLFRMIMVNIHIMTKKIESLMFPFYAKYIPSFNQSFNQFANDPKKEAESLTDTK